MQKALLCILLGSPFFLCAPRQAWCGVKENQEDGREEYLRAHPRELFNARIMGHYAIRDGKPVPFTKLAGTVRGSAAGGGIVLSRKLAATPSPRVVIFAETPQAVARGDKFSIPNVIADDSTCDYPLPNGPGNAEVVLNLKAYREAIGIT
jgi:hypothetical protein